MSTAQAKLDTLIPQEWRDTGVFVSVDRDRAREIIDAIEQSLEFDNGDFDWDAMRGLVDYYSDADTGGDGTVLVLAETGRRLDKSKSGDKSGLSILGGGGLRATVLDTRRTKPALILLQQAGTRDLGWSGHSFWWPILAAPGNAEPCIFASKVAA